MNLMDMENIMDHYKNPRHKGIIKNPSIKHLEYNPLCGDKIEIFLKINNGTLTEAKFNGEGCSISQASASLLLEFANGKELNKVKSITKEDIFEMLGINLSPVRIKCALLGLDTLKNALIIHEKYGEKNG